MHTPTFNLVGTTFLFPLTFLEGFCSCLQQQQATCSSTWVDLCSPDISPSHTRLFPGQAWGVADPHVLVCVVWCSSGVGHRTYDRVYERCVQPLPLSWQNVFTWPWYTSIYALAKNSGTWCSRWLWLHCTKTKIKEWHQWTIIDTSKYNVETSHAQCPKTVEKLPIFLPLCR